MTRRVRTDLLVVGAAAFVLVGAEAADDLVSAESKWRRRDYAGAYLDLSRVREDRGGSADVDYYLGTAACRLPGKAALGALLLEEMRSRYSLSSRQRRAVDIELARCRGTTPVASPGVSAIAWERPEDDHRAVAAYAGCGCLGQARSRSSVSRAAPELSPGHVSQVPVEMRP